MWLDKNFSALPTYPVVLPLKCAQAFGCVSPHSLGLTDHVL